MALLMVSVAWRSAHQPSCLYGLAGSHQGIQQLELGKPWQKRILSSCTSEAWMELNARRIRGGVVVLGLSARRKESSSCLVGGWIGTK